MKRLKIIDSFDLPIAEASGLCTAFLDGVEHLVAVGDADTRLAWTPLVDDLPTEWELLDLADWDELPSDLGQFEAVAAAGQGRVLVLGEEPSLLVLVDLATRACLGWWRLRILDEQDFAELWNRDENSRGEGLIPLADGHVLIVKEKRPVLAVECGFGGRRSEALQADREAWQPPEGNEIPVMHWSRVTDAPSDISDCACPDGSTLVALSDQDQCLVILEHDDESYRAGEPIPLDKKIEKPEGLAVTATGAWFVAMDTRDGDGALVRIANPEF